MSNGITKFTGGNQITVTAGKSLSLFDMKAAYDNYKKVYDATTGKSWTEEKFGSRAKNWIFFGNSDAFVAVRQQGQGGYKLVNIAANPDNPDRDANLKGALTLMLAQNKPTWGLVTKAIAMLAKRAKFLVLPPDLVSDMFDSHQGFTPIIPDFVVTDHNSSYQVNNNGTITVHDNELGTLEQKVAICNEQWIDYSINLINQRIGYSMKALPGGGSVSGPVNLLPGPSGGGVQAAAYAESAFLKGVIAKLAALKGASAQDMLPKTAGDVKQITASESRKRYNSRFLKEDVEQYEDGEVAIEDPKVLSIIQDTEHELMSVIEDHKNAGGPDEGLKYLNYDIDNDKNLLNFNVDFSYSQESKDKDEKRFYDQQKPHQQRIASHYHNLDNDDYPDAETYNEPDDGYSVFSLKLNSDLAQKLLKILRKYS